MATAPQMYLHQCCICIVLHGHKADLLRLVKVCDNLASWTRPTHTSVSPLLESHICYAEQEHRQKRLELHPCSPVAQRRLCVKQK